MGKRYHIHFETSIEYQGRVTSGATATPKKSSLMSLKMLAAASKTIEIHFDVDLEVRLFGALSNVLSSRLNTVPDPVMEVEQSYKQNETKLMPVRKRGVRSMLKSIVAMMSTKVFFLLKNIFK